METDSTKTTGGSGAPEQPDPAAAGSGVRSRAAAFGREVWAVLRGTLGAFMTDKVMRLAAAVAFYTALSLAPILVVVLSVARFFWGRDAEAQAELAGYIEEFFGAQASDAVLTALATADGGDRSGLAALIALGALLFSASLLFAQLQDALNAIWHVEPKPGRMVRGFLRKRGLSLLVVLGIGALLLASLVASSVMNIMTDRVEILAWAEAARTWRTVTAAVTIAILTFLFGMLFVILPDVEVEWHYVWIGAASTAILFSLGKELIALYLATTAVGSGYGAAGSLLAMLVWVYLSAIIFFVGAELTQVIAHRYGHGIRPSRGARWAPGSPEAEAEERAEAG